MDNKDSQGTSYAITRDKQDALLHASPMFSPGNDKQPEISASGAREAKTLRAVVL